MKIINTVAEARQLLIEGKIIAYPTEAVYGLGCDPFNQEAVKKLLTLKQRPASKGLIILIANWSQLTALIQPIAESSLAPVWATWPGPVTWVFPKSALIPEWVSGDQATIAIRMSAHPIAQALCAQGPLVSTSANLSGYPPAKAQAEIIKQFPQGIDAIFAGELGGASQPSTIYHVLTGAQLR